MSPNERGDEKTIVTAAFQISRNSGPLPPPEVLAKYEQMLPGVADRILRMAEEQATHRQRIESAVVDSNVKIQARGLWFGFVVAISAIWGGVWLSIRGISGVGLASIIGALAALVAVFIYGKTGRQTELRRKRSSIKELAESE